MSKDQRPPKHILRPFKVLDPPKHAGKRIVNIQESNDTDSMFNSVRGILKNQFDALSAKARMGGQLQDADAKVLRTHIQSLVELSREERERNKNDGVEEWLAQKGPDEVLKMYLNLMGKATGLENAIEAEAASSTEDIDGKVE